MERRQQMFDQQNADWTTCPQKAAQSTQKIHRSNVHCSKNVGGLPTPTHSKAQQNEQVGGPGTTLRRSHQPATLWANVRIAEWL